MPDTPEFRLADWPLLDDVTSSKLAVIRGIAEEYTVWCLNDGSVIVSVLPDGPVDTPKRLFSEPVGYASALEAVAQAIREAS